MPGPEDIGFPEVLLNPGGLSTRIVKNDGIIFSITIPSKDRVKLQDSLIFPGRTGLILVNASTTPLRLGNTAASVADNYGFPIFYGYFNLNISVNNSRDWWVYNQDDSEVTVWGIEYY